MKRAVTLLALALAACAPKAEGDSAPPSPTPRLDAAASTAPNTTSEPTAPWLTVPSDFPPLPAPEDNALTEQRAALGRRLFYDSRLSRTNDIACGSCHLQQHAFADPERFSIGVDEQRGERNAPALINVAYVTSFFWDGGVPNLEMQAIAPIKNPLEMDMTLQAVCDRLAKDTELVAQFMLAYGEGPNESTLTRALASFERTLISANSPWDAYQRGDLTALSDAEKRGMDVFNGERGECFHCHTGYNLTTNAFRNNGARADDQDSGREKLTQKASDRGKFKVPTLRNVAVTAPYMHDGAFATLAEVIDHYDRGGEGHPNTDPVIFQLDLTAQEKADLRAFLKALTDETFLTDPRFGPP